MKKALTANSLTTTTTTTTTQIPLWHSNVADLSTILESLNTPHHQLQQSVDYSLATETNRLINTSTNLTNDNSPINNSSLILQRANLQLQQQPISNLKIIKPTDQSDCPPSSCSSSSVTTLTSVPSDTNLIDRMANVSSPQLLSAFPSGQSLQSLNQQVQNHLSQQQQQQQQQQTQHQQQQLALQNSNALFQHSLSNLSSANNNNSNNNNSTTNNRGKVKHNRSNSNSLTASQQFLRTSVAFPGSPLQPLNQAQNQNNFQQCRSMQQQQQQQQQQQSQQQQLQQQQLQSLSANNNTNQSGQLQNTAAVVAAVTASHFVSSWPCPACKIAFRTANDLQTHLSTHFNVPPQHQNAQHVQTQQKQQNGTNNNFIGAGGGGGGGVKHSNNAKTNMQLTIQHQTPKEKTVPCNQCGKMFSSAQRVRVHTRNSHGEKTCSCEVCGTEFSYRCKLVNHMRTHTGQKPYTCEICDRSFSQKNHLKRHHMIHTGERPFQCETCGRSFYRKDKLTRHRLVHTNPCRGNGAPRTPKASRHGISSLNSSAAIAAQLNAPLIDDGDLAMKMGGNAPGSGNNNNSTIPARTIQFIPVAAQFRNSAAVALATAASAQLAQQSPWVSVHPITGGVGRQSELPNLDNANNNANSVDGGSGANGKQNSQANEDSINLALAVANSVSQQHQQQLALQNSIMQASNVISLNKK